MVKHKVAGGEGFVQETVFDYKFRMTRSVFRETAQTFNGLSCSPLKDLNVNTKGTQYKTFEATNTKLQGFYPEKAR